MTDPLFGTCPICARRMRLRVDGTLRHHVDLRRPDPNSGFRGWHAVCAGVGKPVLDDATPPEDAAEAVQRVWAALADCLSVASTYERTGQHGEAHGVRIVATAVSAALHDELPAKP